MTTFRTPPQSGEGSRSFTPSSGSTRPRGAGGPPSGGYSRGQGGGGSSRGPGGPGGQFRGGRRSFRRGRRVCNFCVDHVDSVDYKAVNRLRRYVSDRARIDSSKKTGTCAKHQRMVRRAIVKARFMALLPYSPDHTRVTNMLAPRTPAETVETEPVEASADAAEGSPEGESAAQTAGAAAVDAVEQTTDAQETKAAESAPAVKSGTAEAAQVETAPASAASDPVVAQPEGKSESDDKEEAKV